ncbi:MAG TPA: tRNA (adenosine(37)-N6)-dimethylallyltransferase MiaA [Candidatus Krumholzibacteria bacterium]|nr:tRNA (adenosine(37)-N6)-dimethylallyltransferase MiaA [Candidatus Krumholzibacteria bacterium]
MTIPARCISIMGATATGKSALAIDLATEFHGEIVSMDSRQVYRGFTIGTAKPPLADMQRVPHHLIDTLDPVEPTSAGRHAAAAESVVRDVVARGAVPILAGGTGLYFRAFFHGLAPVVIPRAEQMRLRDAFSGRSNGDLYSELERRDPDRARALSPNDRVRITRALEIIAYTGLPASELLRRRTGGAGGLTHFKLVLTLPRPMLHARIEKRTRALFDAGWVDEVRGLLAADVPADCPAMRGLGYAEIAGALSRGEDPAGCLDAVVTATRQYAKRQETFFRGERDAVWVDIGEEGATRRVRGLVRAFLAAGGANPGPQ